MKNFKTNNIFLFINSVFFLLIFKNCKLFTLENFPYDDIYLMENNKNLDDNSPINIKNYSISSDNFTINTNEESFDFIVNSINNTNNVTPEKNISLSDDCSTKKLSSIKKKSHNKDYKNQYLLQIKNNPQKLESLKFKNKQRQIKYIESLKNNPIKFEKEKESKKNYYKKYWQDLKNDNEKLKIVQDRKKKLAQIYWENLSKNPEKLKILKIYRQKYEKKRKEILKNNPIALQNFKNKKKMYQQKYINKLKENPLKFNEFKEKQKEKYKQRKKNQIL